MSRLLRWLPPTLTLLYIVAIGCGYVYLRLYTRLAAYHASSVGEIAPFLAVFGLVVYCFVATAVSDAGTWTHQSSDRPSPAFARQCHRSLSPALAVPVTYVGERVLLLPCVDSKANGCRRYCRACQCYKPDRCHHCATCDRCVLRNDHHCVFVGNCIAANNHKHFMLFLLYAAVACLYVTVHTLACDPVSVIEQFRLSVVLPIIVLFVLVTASGIAVLGFFALHLWLVMNNSTTIETMEKERPLYSTHAVNPYDGGVWFNLCAVLGPWWSWLLPVKVRTSRQPSGCDMYDEMLRDSIVFEVSIPHPQRGWFGVPFPSAVRDDGSGDDEQPHGLSIDSDVVLKPASILLTNETKAQLYTDIGTALPASVTSTRLRRRPR